MQEWASSIHSHDEIGLIETLRHTPTLSSMQWLVVSSTSSLPVSMKALLSPTFATVRRLPNRTAMVKVVPATSKRDLDVSWPTRVRMLVPNMGVLSGLGCRAI